MLMHMRRFSTAIGRTAAMRPNRIVPQKTALSKFSCCLCKTPRKGEVHSLLVTSTWILPGHWENCGNMQPVDLIYKAVNKLARSCLKMLLHGTGMAEPLRSFQ